MSRFSSLDDLRRAATKLPSLDSAASATARQRQDTLTKPQGSLGRLEEIAIWLAGCQRKAIPELAAVRVIVFAGSHGVTARGVSAFPAEVTGQMVANFAAGGAAINQLARSVGATLSVVPLSIETPTADFSREPAMSDAAFLDAVSTGYDAVQADTDLLCLGEMGIGNTTAAAAVAAGLFGGTGAEWVGRGTGVDDEGLKRKAGVVDEAITLHASRLGDPLAVLAALGGRELAAIFGATLAARHHNVPVLLDGFVCTSAAAPLFRLTEGGLDHAMVAHASAEAGHRKLMAAIQSTPILDLGMRLGEASGACLAVNIVRSALACHTGMASFAEAGVSDR